MNKRRAKSVESIKELTRHDPAGSVARRDFAKSHTNMAESNPKPQTEVHAGDALKTKSALREEAVLAFWQEHNIFEKSVKKDSPKGNFVFFDGPPYATGLPHFGHMIPSTIKDIIPRYKTMQGYSVARKWGWDCHGLPIENLIEKELGLTDKKAIEEYGIAKFNKAAKDSVFRYDVDWKRLVQRAGRWVDMENDYHTMDSSYTESVWWSFKTLQEKGLIYEAYKVMPFCPRCQTVLSNSEVGLGYKDIPDISAYVLFELLDAPAPNGKSTGESFLAWTTTPWTLPGNTALAVHPELMYSLVEVKQKDKETTMKVWLAKDLIAKLQEKNILPEDVVTLKEVEGVELAGISYNPPFDFYTKIGTLSANEESKRENAWKVQTADFVTAVDGTGIVHIAPAFGDDDYKLSVEKKMPVILHVSADGKIKEGNGTLSGLIAKPKGDHQLTDIEVIKLLAYASTHDVNGDDTGIPLLFAKEKLVHSYPHCWRCDTPLLNYATSSWFVRVTELKDKLLAENNKINWVPKEVGEGRFGKWLENVRDWAISRSRYWGAPLPIWRGEKTGRVEFIGSVEELKSKIAGRGNGITLMRHGEAESNVLDVISSDPSEEGREKYGLTMNGRGQVEISAQALLAKQKETGRKITKIYSSDFRRTRETAEHVASVLGIDKSQIIFDARLREINGGDFDGGKWSGRNETGFFRNRFETIYKKNPNGESVEDVKRRGSEFLYDLDSKNENEEILVVTHGLPLRLMMNTVNGQTCRDLLRSGWRDYSDPNASLHPLDFKQLPHNDDFELDIHRPFIDQVTWESEVKEGTVLLDGTKAGEGISADIKKEKMVRVPEVFDVWYDSGSMPFAQAHYPFENKELFEEQSSPIFPADFIAEGLDQTRGWFYSLMVLGVGLFGKSPYKNVIVNGLMLAEDGRKMSKSLRNYPDMEPTFNKYGVDPLRYFIASSSVTHSEEVLFSEKALDEINKKIFNRLENVSSFYTLYADNVPVQEGQTPDSVPHSDNVLDTWMVARLASLKNDIEKGLESYQIDKAARPIADIVDDLSTWYLRRSRDRFKGDDAKDKEQAMQTTRFVMLTLSKLIAPFVPFMAEHMYQSIRNEIARVNTTASVLMPESVHLAKWPELPIVNHGIIEAMKVARKLVEAGLAIRAKAGVKVRQPLASFTYTAEDASSESGAELSEAFLQIIQEELNVKEVKKGAELALDTNLTTELKEEGVVRDVIRGAQEARKNAGLVPSDFIVLTVSTTAEVIAVLKKNEDMLKKPIQAEKVEYMEVSAGTREGSVGENEPVLEVTKI